MSVAVAIAFFLIAMANATPVPNEDWTTKSSTAVDDPGRVLCRLKTTDPFVHNKVRHLLTVDTATLINYVLNFSNYSNNPLTINMDGVYDAQKWSRVITAHGQTLLSLAFNYGVLSMMTLTLGTVTLPIELQDSPLGCFSAASNKQRVE